MGRIRSLYWQGYGVRAELIEVVVDFDEFGSPLGVKLLGVLDQHPGMAARLADCSSEHLKVTYDEEADAIYFRLAEGRSLDQAVRVAALAISPEGELLSLHVRLEG